MAYASQNPWILNTSLRENILFGAKFERQRYDKVLRACCLTRDVETMPAKDMTEVKWAKLYVITLLYR